MKALFYEMKKTILRKYMLVFLILGLFLNGFLIYIQYCQAGIGFSQEITEKSATEGEWKYYQQLHEWLDGNITMKKVEYVTDEFHKYQTSVSNQMYSTKYDPENTHTGYFFGDYSILSTYFYQPLEYSVKYSLNNEKIVEQAKENIVFYSEKENLYEKEKNQYIVKCYKDRSIREFYDFQGWDKLLAYDYSDLFVVVLFLLAIVPCYYNEEQYKMTEILLISKKRRKFYIQNKRYALYLWVFCLVTIFSLSDYMIFDVLYGMNGNHVNLYVLSDYQYSAFGGSILGFYCFGKVMKCFGFIVFIEMSAWFIRRMKSVYAIYAVLVLFFVLGLYGSGFLCSVNPLKQYLSLLNPLSIFGLVELGKGCYGIGVFGHFVPWLFLFVIVQLIIWLIFHYMFGFVEICVKNRGFDCKSIKNERI